jgi:hypothetical protein
MMNDFNPEAGRAWFDALPKESVSHPEFDAWMAKVNKILDRRTGLTADDLPDYCYRDDFDDGATPSQAASHAIRAAKDF